MERRPRKGKERKTQRFHTASIHQQKTGERRDIHPTISLLHRTSYSIPQRSPGRRIISSDSCFRASFQAARAFPLPQGPPVDSTNVLQLQQASKQASILTLILIFYFYDTALFRPPSDPTPHSLSEAILIRPYFWSRVFWRKNSQLFFFVTIPL